MEWGDEDPWTKPPPPRMALSHLPGLSRRALAAERNQAAYGGHVDADGQNLHAALQWHKMLRDKSL